MAFPWRRRRKPLEEDAAPDIPILFSPRPQQAARDHTRVSPRRGDLIPAGTGSSADGFVQLLPGRLTPLMPEVHQEIRFVRSHGSMRFTFGRGADPSPAHIQLQAPTTSRLHAYMSFENGRWRIGNLSRTNPVVVNGVPLESGELLLADGDRIEFGEVVFVFRER